MGIRMGSREALAAWDQEIMQVFNLGEDREALITRFGAVASQPETILSADEVTSSEQASKKQAHWLIQSAISSALPRSA